MKIFAIKNKITGLYLEKEKAYKQTTAKFGNKPRLFTTKAGAKNAMQCWSMGVWGRIYNDEDMEGPTPPNKKPDDRKLEDLEVIEGFITWNI